MSAAEHDRDSHLDSRIAASVRDISDFPKPGVMFKDITPLLADHTLFTDVVAALAAIGRDSNGEVVVDRVLGMEARGFILGAPVALALGVGFVPVRKPGKLPWETRGVSYDLEYGQETLEIHTDALERGNRVLMIDDVLATGGTARATADLIEQAGATVHALAVLMELTFLPGRDAIRGLTFASLHAV